MGPCRDRAVAVLYVAFVSQGIPGIPGMVLSIAGKIALAVFEDFR